MEKRNILGKYQPNLLDHHSHRMLPEACMDYHVENAQSQRLNNFSLGEGNSSLTHKWRCCDWAMIISFCQPWSRIPRSNHTAIVFHSSASSSPPSWMLNSLKVSSDDLLQICIWHLALQCHRRPESDDHLYLSEVGRTKLPTEVEFVTETAVCVCIMSSSSKSLPLWSHLRRLPLGIASPHSASTLLYWQGPTSIHLILSNKMVQNFQDQYYLLLSILKVRTMMATTNPKILPPAEVEHVR